MIARVVVTLLVTAVSLLGDGATLQLHAPAPPPASHPPMSVDRVRETGPSALSARQTRAALGAAARLFVERPNDSALGSRLLELARSAGREDWLRDFVRASARRLPTAATLLLSAELEDDRGAVDGRMASIRRAHHAAPNDAEVAIVYAVALGASGKPLEAYAVLPPSLRERKAWPALSDRALERLSIITAAVAPEGLGDLIATEWLLRTWRSHDRSARAGALALVASLAAATGRDAARHAITAASLAHVVGSADPEASAMTLMNAAELSGDTSVVRRFEGVCEVFPEVSSVARADCLVSALQHAVFIGAFPRALDLYGSLPEQSVDNPLMALRLGGATMSLLELNGDYRQSARLATAAAAAAAMIGDRHLESKLLVRLARAQRLVGDFPAARAAALRAVAVAGAGDEVAQRATLERIAADRGVRGEPAWLEAGTAGSRYDEALLHALLSADGPISAGSISSGSGGATPSSDVLDLDEQGFAALVEDLRRGLKLETEQRAEEALAIYLRAIDYWRSHQAAQADDLLESATIADVWQGVTRRALGLALASGKARLGLQILEAGRSWSRTGNGNDRLSVGPFSAGQLPHRTALVGYAVDGTRTWAVVLRREKTTLLEIPVEPASLRDQVALWRELAKSNSSVARWRALGHRLARSLLAPLDTPGLLDGIDHLWIVPDDVLHLVPFATLVKLRGEEEFGYSVSQFLSVAGALRPRTSQPSGAPLVAFGAGGGSGILDEMLSIRHLSGSLYIGARATETAWKRESVAASAIHFGGHATPLGGSQWATALQLRADSTNDGRLTLAEILALPLRGTVVVLLGCDTAARPEQPGPAAYYRQVPSLGEAFLDAGASAVVGNLWPITEEDAKLMAQEFYGAGGPARGAAALEQARTVLRRRFPDMPRRWAGAVWLGAAEPFPTAPTPWDQ